ncbi:methylase [Gordonia phage Sapo]|nr:methylase [Gordonia phage Sapo]
MSFGYTTDPTKRSKTDDYPTDSRWVDVLLDNTRTSLRYAHATGDLVFDLAVSGPKSQLVDALRARDVRAYAHDLDFFDEENEAWLRTGGLQLPYHHVTNPPYKVFKDWAVRALDVTPGCVALLGGVHALASKHRREELWLPHRPTEVLVVVNNQTVLGKTSQFAHVWFVWDEDRTPSARLDWVQADTSKPALHRSVAPQE